MSESTKRVIRAMAERVDAGEHEDAVMRDYGMTCLTPAAQAVLDAAVTWDEQDERGTGLQAAYRNLKDAIRRYREAQGKGAA